MDTITNRKKQALETKRKIYDIAVKLFAEYGFDKVSIQQICKECEIIKRAKKITTPIISHDFTQTIVTTCYSGGYFFVKL